MSNEREPSEAKKISLLAALLAVALGAVVYSWRATNAPTSTRTSTSSAGRSEIAQTSDDADDLEASVRRRLEESARVLDVSEWQERTAPPPPPPPPSAPVVQASAAVGELRLKGIARGATATAFINDSALEQGEAISGHTLVEIGAEHVVLQAPSGERITLHMRGLE